MEYAGATALLVLERGSDGKSYILSVVRDNLSLLKRWNSTTRVSPIFTVAKAGKTNYEATSPETHTFDGSRVLFFIGPAKPERLLPKLDEKSSIWLTLGLKNVIVAVPFDRKKSFEAWLKSIHIAFECWELDSGRVISMPSLPPRQLKPALSEKLQYLVAKTYPPEITEALREFTPLLASTLSRAEGFPEEMVQDLHIVLDQTQSRLRELDGERHMTAPAYKAYSRLNQNTSAIARFNSQALASSPKIIDTECYCWSHSLLGVATPIIALWNLQAFLRKQLEESHLFERFANFTSRTNPYDLLTFEGWPSIDIVAEVPLESPFKTTHTPLIPYFSSRDGFKTKHHAISAPFASIASGNSARWSLMTLTHEFSHVYMRAIVTMLTPNESNPSYQDLYTLLKKDRTALGSTILQELQRVVLLSILELDYIAYKSKPEKIVPAEIERIFLRWHRFLDEVMAHTFDFAYFYGRRHQRYIRGIWNSWSALPSISEETLIEYVLRTVAAVMLRHLGEPNAEELARRDVRPELEAMQKKEHGTSYITKAIKLLDERWDDYLYPCLNAVRYLVMIVGRVLFSEKLAQNLLSDECVVSGEEGLTAGYAFKPGDIDNVVISNPLRFLRTFSGDAKASPSRTAWMFQTLAHHVRNFDS